jgi:anti-anti-sigma factor
VTDTPGDGTFGITLDQRDGSLVLHVRGDLDCDVAGLLRQAMLGSGGSGPVIVDLAAVPFMDSAGLGALVAGVRHARERGGGAGIAGPRPPLRRLLQVTGVERLAPVGATVEEVLARLGEPDQRP